MHTHRQLEMNLNLCLSVVLCCLVLGCGGAATQFEGTGAECFMKEFQRNITIQDGKLLRLGCPTNCPAIWLFADTVDGERREVVSDFENPPYFYILDTSVQHSGWYWCRVHQGYHLLEASLSVEVLGDKPAVNAIITSTETTLEVIDIEHNLPIEHVEHIEEDTTAPVVDIPPPVSAEEANNDGMPTKSELAEMLAKYLQTIHRQLSDINGRLEYIEEKLKTKA
eukprot:GFUD01079868.1.p1 GENE.GFUD01079868.1~~GFUD01079868.1.p1  ORF type:complete len:224 (-),score=70.74 GFUD01079868.1:65-736(-)